MFQFVLASSVAVGLVSEPKTIQFDFPGGTVLEYVNQAQDMMPDLNVIVSQEAEDCMVPAFRLKLTRFDEEYSPVERLIEEVLPSVVVENAGVKGPVKLLQVNAEDFGDGEPGSRLYTVGLSPYSLMIDVLDQRYMVAMGLGEFMKKGISESDLLAAVEASMEAAVVNLDADQWSIRYHEATHVAFVSVPLKRSDQAERAIRMLTNALSDSLGIHVDMGFGSPSLKTDMGFGSPSLEEDDWSDSEEKEFIEKLEQSIIEHEEEMEMLRKINDDLEDQNADLAEKLQRLEAQMASLQSDMSSRGAAGGAGGGDIPRT